MNWEVCITGDKSSLDALCKTFNESDISINERDGEFFLKSNRFEKLESKNEVKKVATEIISSLCGATKLIYGAKDPIKYFYILKIDVNEKKTVYMEGSAVISISGSIHAEVVDSEGNIIHVESSDDIPTIVKLALKDINVSDALRLYGNKKLDWVNLYRLLEIVVKDVGGIDQIANNNWASKKEIRRFKNTSGSWRVLKDEARHASESTDPPPNPMSLPEARSLISEIIRMWLKSKIVK